MAAAPEHMNALRRELAENRIALSEAATNLGASLDVPARVGRAVKDKVAAHPLKWVLLAVAGGLVAARAVPLVVGLLRTAGSRRIVGTLLTTVAPVVVRAGLNALGAHDDRGDRGAAEDAENRPPDDHFRG